MPLFVSLEAPSRNHGEQEIGVQIFMWGSTLLLESPVNSHPETGSTIYDCTIRENTTGLHQSNNYVIQCMHSSGGREGESISKCELFV